MTVRHFHRAEADFESTLISIYEFLNRIICLEVRLCIRKKTDETVSLVRTVSAE